MEAMSVAACSSLALEGEARGSSLDVFFSVVRDERDVAVSLDGRRKDDDGVSPGSAFDSVAEGDRTDPSEGRRDGAIEGFFSAEHCTAPASSSMDSTVRVIVSAGVSVGAVVGACVSTDVSAGATIGAIISALS